MLLSSTWNQCWASRSEANLFQRISSKLSNIPLIVCVVRVPFSHIFVFVPLWVVEVISVAHLFRRCRWFFSVFVPRESDNKGRILGERLPVIPIVLVRNRDSIQVIFVLAELVLNSTKSIDENLAQNYGWSSLFKIAKL